MSIAQQAQAVLWRIEVAPARPELDAHGSAILKDIHDLGLRAVQQVASSHLYLLEGELSRDEAGRIGSELLADPVTEQLHVGQGGDDRSLPGAGFEGCVEVHLKGGVMDVVAGSMLGAIADMGIDSERLAAATARLYRIKGVKSVKELEFVARRLLFNDCIEDVYLTGFGRHDPRPERLPVAPTRAFELRHVPIRNLDAEALKRLSRDAHLFLSLDEMRGIQNHYRDLGRDPTDLELEMLAQTWSEHCVHKTLKSAVRYAGAPLPDPDPAKRQAGKEVVVEYENLLRDTIARATNELIERGKASWCLSVFKDNAGVIEFDADYAVAFKVETHNHPSAIEPYGGSATGIGGVIRDVMGCGLGAKPIANTDVFCVGRPDFPMDSLPKGVLHPRRVLKGVVAGVRDYGNRMGIPTVNGAVVFDDRYLGNPLVFCGCVGLMPNWTIEKEPQPGDLVVVLGGRTGRDGIHGATFSSAELTDTHADEFSHAVQIGNAITEKQVLDAMLRMRNDGKPGSCLYTATTDCGAGGLSSAVGEMAEKLGADVELDNVPLKYAGLRYDEIWISEAQERMVIAVPPGNWPEVKRICDAEGVEATVIGKFRNDGRLIIRYGGQVVGEMDTAFLHGGIPKTRREATWRKGEAAGLGNVREAASGKANGVIVQGSWTKKQIAKVWPPGSWAKDELLHRLSQLDTASKEWIFRQYDHEVQGGSVIKPLSGPGEGPSDAAVLRPRLSSNKGVVLANGICPARPGDDPYWTAVAAIDEAIRNVVCVGGNPDRTAILDNFCWGNCENPETMGALVRACQACYDAATTYGVPFISGKDSLNNEFALDPADADRLAKRIPLANNRIRIPETLLISAMSVIDDVSKCITMDAKVLLGRQTSFYFVGLSAEQWEQADLRQAAGLHRAIAGLIQTGRFVAVHDCGSEGMMVALAEMAFAGRCGASAWTVEKGELADPFAAVPCGYIVQVADEGGLEKLVGQYKGTLIRKIGQSRGDDKFVWHKSAGGEPVFEVTLDALSQAWRNPLAW